MELGSRGDALSFSRAVFQLRFRRSICDLLNDWDFGFSDLDGNTILIVIKSKGFLPISAVSRV